MTEEEKEKILNSYPLRNNEFMELVKRLLEPYGKNYVHYEVINASKTVNGWRLEIARIEEGGAENESNK